LVSRELRAESKEPRGDRARQTLAVSLGCMTCGSLEESKAQGTQSIAEGRSRELLIIGMTEPTGLCEIHVSLLYIVMKSTVGLATQHKVWRGIMMKLLLLLPAGMRTSH
jgi:hypothetical protein